VAEQSKALVPATAQERSTTPVAPDAAEHARVTGLIVRAQGGDAQALHDLRALMVWAPSWHQQYPGPVTRVRRMLLEATVGKNLLDREMWERRAAAMEQELAGPHPTLLERTLCERIASCWLDVQLADLTCAEKLKESLSFAAGDFWQRRQDRSHARYLSAVQTLARVRRLLAPVVAQVNIAQPGAQQLNVASVGRPEPDLLTSGPRDDASVSMADGWCLP
jgi:hypothetical protein